MWNRRHLQEKIAKLNQLKIRRIMPLVIFMTIFLLGLSLGIADPGSKPPLPT